MTAKQDVEALIERLWDACVASCSCLTKTPEIQYHAPDCRYRLFQEAAALLRSQADALASSQAEVERLQRGVDRAGYAAHEPACSSYWTTDDDMSEHFDAKLCDCDLAGEGGET